MTHGFGCSLLRVLVSSGRIVPFMYREIKNMVHARFLQQTSRRSHIWQLHKKLREVIRGSAIE